jgi:UDP-N-acetylglucosamine diphosphorylase / glucose-1-phosphate thymidylyltransferase / UDP-N-acetylgalactosamine diphosphorylase / glucosamine-1-phosphate N-acetyltransferase / galactosamine-1-phosphate N-acetyltransferase
MFRYIIEDDQHVLPFNEPASLITIGLKPLKLHQEDILLEYLGKDCELAGVFHDPSEIPSVKGEAVVYRDNLWFDYDFFQYFMDTVRKKGKAVQAAFSANDKAFMTYTYPLSTDFIESKDAQGDTIYLMDLYYFPNDYTSDIEPIVVPSDAHEIGFYSVPDFMTMQQGNLTHYTPMRAVMSIETWVHVYFASIIFGNFARAGRLDRKIESSAFKNLQLLWHAVLEQKQIMRSSATVKIGKNCSIDPSVVITGPAKIGDNVSIGAGCVLDNCTIGDNVTIDAGCVLMMSTVGSNCFLPFRAALYLTHVMENTIIAQNTCLQMCVIGRSSFVGAGNTFTDFNLIAQKPIRAVDQNGDLRSVGQIVLGSAVGHNCRVGSGMVIMPGRMVESDVVLVASPTRRVIGRTITFDESDHHFVRGGDVHQRFYPRFGEAEELSMVEEW